MTIQAAVTLTILIVTLVVLGTQRLRPDLTAICATLALILTGILSPAEAFSAFGQPVIIIIPSIYVLGAALVETGVATMIANRLSRLSNQGPVVLMLVIMITAGLLSAVLSSLLVIALLLPAVLRITRRTRVAPSQLLLPLVAGATMGNLLTVIGTVSTLVVGDLLLVSGGESLGFFGLTPYGLASLALAALWYLLAGRKLLRREAPEEPSQPSLDEVEQAYRLDKQLYRLRVRSISDLIAHRLDDSPLGTSFHLNVLAIQSGDSAPRPARPDWILERDDVLIVEGSRGDILQAAGIHHLEPKGTMPLEEFNRLEHDTLRLAELMVPFRSRLVGKTLAESRFRERYGLNILAVRQQGESIRESLPHQTLQGGDTLLVQGARSTLRRVGRDLDLVLVTHLGPQPGDLITGKARLTLAILGVMLVCVVSGLLSLATATLAAAVVLILTGCVSLERAYQSIDGRVIVLIGGMLPLAMALETTGAAELIAQQFAALSPAVGPMGSLLLLYLFTAVITQVISNMATAALVMPIALNLAAAQGLSPVPFAIAIAVAVTTSYVTPLTNTDNLMIRDAGRYTMRDYLVNGLPIFLLQTTVIMLMLWILY
jgi:di/tricarboxylate transporter